MLKFNDFINWNRYQHIGHAVQHLLRHGDTRNDNPRHWSCSNDQDIRLVIGRDLTMPLDQIVRFRSVYIHHATTHDLVTIALDNLDPHEKDER